MATYYDGLNAFFKLNEANPLASSAQLVYLHLLHINNREWNTGSIRVSDGELRTRTRLSKQTITEAKRILKNLGLIDFKTNRNKPREGTDYTLTFFANQEVGHEVGQKVGQKVGCKVGRTFIDLNSPKNITEEFKIKDINSDTRMRVNKEIDQLDEVADYWDREIRGARLTMEHLSWLKKLLEAHGATWVKEAMKVASDINDSPYGVSIALLKGVIERKATPSPTKERGNRDEKRIAERSEPKYEEPNYNSTRYSDLLGQGNTSNE